MTPLPRVEAIAPLIPAVLDLLLPVPVGRQQPDAVTLAAFADHVDARCHADLAVALPRLRHLVELDIAAAVEGDPACVDATEAALCLPGVHAIAVHRLAHELLRMGVPRLPRVLAACTHHRTGIDIHPGAQIDHSFFIDHGTGVVIGATAVIGAHCTIYQGVTLGASSVRPGMDRHAKRHPTLQDHVVVYAGATILGGDTVIGSGSVIGGGVFVLDSVPPRHVVTNPRPVVELREHQRTPPVLYSI